MQGAHSLMGKRLFFTFENFYRDHEEIVGKLGPVEEVYACALGIETKSSKTWKIRKITGGIIPLVISRIPTGIMRRL